MQIRPTAGALALSACFTALPAAATPSYRLVDLGEDSVAYAMNHHGEVAGIAPDGHAGLYTHGVWHAKSDRHGNSFALAIDDAGDMVGMQWGGRAIGWQPMFYPRGDHDSLLPIPAGASNVAPEGISPDGSRVVGTYLDGVDHRDRCFQWHPGDAALTEIPLPDGMVGCEAMAVNDAGQVLGELQDAGMKYTRFIWQDGQFTDLGRGKDAAAAMAINRHGHAIASNEAGGQWDWVWNGRHLRRLPQTGWVNMIDPTALNDRGEIVGVGLTTPDQYLTIVKYADGVMTDLVPLVENADGWDFSYGGPAGINERGEIAGTAWITSGSTMHSHGYLLVPND